MRDLSSLSEEERQRILQQAAKMARAQIAKICNRPDYKAAVKRLILASFHAKQTMVWEDLQNGKRYISLCCTRRAGKTFFLASLIILLLMECRFGQDVVFIAPTMKRGKELIWREVARLVDEYCLGWKLSENLGTITTHDGAYFRIVGLDKEKQVGKVARGGNTRAFLADEVQEYGHLLRKFVVAASPALAQLRGALIFSGTPGIAEAGYWFATCHGREGFTSRHWTLHENPHLGRSAAEIIEEELRERYGGDDTHPDFVREWKGLWTRDRNRLVFEFERARNLVTEPADYDVRGWKHFIGVDYGLKDPCAWVVLAAHPERRDVYVVHAHKEDGLTSDQIAAETAALVEWFKPVAVVGDSASGGATFIKDFNVRYGREAGVRMRHAQKRDKFGRIKTMNTELRTSRLRLVEGAADELADEMTVLQYADDERSKILEGASFPDHCCDGGLYALSEFTTWRHKAAANANPTEDELERERIRERNRQAEDQLDEAGGWG